MQVVYVILIVVTVSVILTLISKRQKDSSWEGTVTKVREYHHTDSEDNTREGVNIYYRTDTGKKGKLDLNKWAFSQTYAGIREGDRLIKKSGEYMPQLVKAVEENASL